MSDKLHNALKARIPIIHVRTTDVVYLSYYLEYLTGNSVNFYKNGEKNIKENSVYLYTGEQLMTVPEVYTKFSEKDSCLVVCTSEHDLFYYAGILTLDPEYTKLVIADRLDKEHAEEITNALGGLTQKQVYDILGLSQVMYGDNTVTSIQKTRREYITPNKGLELVPTDLDGYMPDKNLKKYARAEKQFFLGDYDSRLVPRGLMAYGHHGTGKSMGAKYVAQTWGVPLYRLGADIQDRWVGSSEANLKAALEQLESLSPVVCLFDEIEKFFSKDSSDSGVTQKLLGTLLWWLQERKHKVFVYMTCNNMSVLPPELYRSGRVDYQIEFKKLNLVEAESLTDTILSSYSLPKLQSTRIKNAVISDLVDYEDNLFTHAEVNELLKEQIKNLYRKKR